MFEFLKDKDNRPPKAAKVILIGITAFVAGLLVFYIGLRVGYRKASYSYGFGSRYERNFVAPRRGGMMGGVMGGFRDDSFFGGHGVAGRVLNADAGTLVVQDRDGSEKTVVIDSQTVIRLFRDSVTADEISPDDFVTVIGDPGTDGRIAAKLIRIMPTPPPDGAWTR